jgi:N-acylneuraminate cytidylyltransferase
MYEKNKKFITGFVNKISEPYNITRQMLPRLFFQTGDIELIKRSTLMKGSVSGNKILPIFMKKKTIDIDTLEDFKKQKKIKKC